MKPTDRSISPHTSSSTSPIAMIAQGAATCETLTTLSWVKNWLLANVKYMPKATATTKTLASRCWLRRTAVRRITVQKALPPGGPSSDGPMRSALRSAVSLTLSSRSVRLPACYASASPRRQGAVPAGADRPPAIGAPVRLGSRGGDRTGPWNVLLRRGRALVPRACGQVWADVGLGHEQQPGVGRRRRRQATRELVKVQVEDRQEPLEVGLLVDGEAQAPGLDLLQGLWVEVKPARRHLALQVVLLDYLA